MSALIKGHVQIRKTMQFLCMALFLCAFFVSEAHAQANIQCSRNAIGDVICPPGEVPYDGINQTTTSVFTNPSSLFLNNGPLSSVFGDIPGLESIFGNLGAFFDDLPAALSDAMMMQILGLLDGDVSTQDILAILEQFQSIEGALDGLQTMGCGGSTFNADYLSYAHNAIALKISQIDDLSTLDTASMIMDVCEDVGTPAPAPPGSDGGSGGSGTGANGFPPVDSSSVSGQRIAESAYNSIGMSTADNPLTQGGSLGCALAVSRILNAAGYGVGEHVGTASLFDALNSDPCFEVVDTGHVDDAALEPGDVLVTKRGTGAGHTGVYVGEGKIVSNSSSGFNGSAKGTVQQNYSQDSWYGVTKRNPGGSAVFRRVCD